MPLTGGTDLAGMLVKAGIRTVQMIGIPQEPLPDDVDAVVIALKSRTSPATEAIEESLAALCWLQAAGCRQFYFKYCSTFDSTPQGNIGPVAEALMDALGTDFTIACPAFPANSRSVYQGYLFVGDTLLSESGMRNHPLTPMTDSSLVRVLQQQVQRGVGLVAESTVMRGASAIEDRFAELRTDSKGFAIVDAISNDDLMAIGAACADLPLVTGGSGIALGLPQNFRRQGLLGGDTEAASAASLPPTGGLRAVVSGSCSVATQAQVEVMRARHPAFNVDPLRLAEGEDVVAAALDWAKAHVTQEPVLIYATAAPELVKEIQARIGVARAGSLVC